MDSYYYNPRLKLIARNEYGWTIDRGSAERNITGLTREELIGFGFEEVEIPERALNAWYDYIENVSFSCDSQEVFFNSLKKHHPDGRN